MNKIISIVGPTSSGKTSFALRLAKQALELKNEKGEQKYFGVDLISVDSKQVYKGLAVLSGADIPENFSLVDSSASEKNTSINVYPFFKHSQLPIILHGVSIIDLTEDWSVSHFKNFAISIITKSWEKNRLPILVGGTGLYHQHLFNTDENLYVPPNLDLRKKAKKMSVVELQNWLKETDQNRFEKMNNSDRNNPRRLVRAIEILLGTPEQEKVKQLPTNFELETIGLTLDLEKIEKKIIKRVVERFDTGVLKEVKSLQKICGQNQNNKNQKMSVCSTLGVSDLSEYLASEISQEECIKNWSLHEFQYAKRQMTWFKKNEEIIWLDDTQKKQYTLK